MVSGIGRYNFNTIVIDQFIIEGHLNVFPGVLGDHPHPFMRQGYMYADCPTERVVEKQVEAGDLAVRFGGVTDTGFYGRKAIGNAWPLLLLMV